MENSTVDRAFLDSLAQDIADADRAYYNTGHSIMTDQIYDAKKALLQKHDPAHPVLSKVGNSPSGLWSKAKHQIPMGSLAKVNSEEEFRKYASKHSSDEHYVLQHKLDGLSLSVIFQHGQFTQAITRGDGEIGEDITNNVRRMKNLVPTLKDPSFSGATRCEILLPIEDFDRINNILTEDDRYENCRNAAAGISRRLDGQFSQYLTLLFYDVIPEGEEIAQESEKIELLKKLGLETVDYVLGSVETMVAAFESLRDKRESLPYKIDGAVIKMQSCAKQKELGWIGGKPRGQISWKFDPPGAATVLESVSFEVGRTGVVTPLGHVTPVEIDGSTISNVTLHNIAEIQRLDIGIGDLVMLVKCNDIIPKILHVIERKNQPIVLPTNCPSCKSLLTNDGIRLFCASSTCPAKGHNRVLNWIKVVGIDNFGEGLLDALEEHVSPLQFSIWDIYQLKPGDIAGMCGYGLKIEEKILQNIDKTRTLPLPKFLAGIGIPGLSTKTASDLAEKFENLQAILQLDVETIAELHGYSDISATEIVKGLEEFHDEIVALREIIKIEDVKKVEGPLSGMSFCFTGEMSKPRSHFQGLVMRYGGKVDSSVTKTTTHLVCNEDKGSSKIKKAQQYGTKVINESQFLGMIE